MRGLFSSSTNRFMHVVGSRHLVSSGYSYLGFRVCAGICLHHVMMSDSMLACDCNTKHTVGHMHAETNHLV